MRRRSLWLMLMILLVFILPIYVRSSGTVPTATLQPYDPKSNPEEDLRKALNQAKMSQRRILMEVGGNWCIWCRTMERFFDEHRDLQELRNSGYIMLKINYSPENKNSEFLKKYPKIPGYPHIFILDSSGKVLHSQDTSQLEEGKSYNLAKFKALLRQWAPPKGK